MAHGFPVPLTHKVPIDHNDLPFVRLSMIKIFPSAADQAKKAALKGILFCQIKGGRRRKRKKKKKTLTTNQDAVEESNIEQSGTSCLTWEKKMVHRFPIPLSHKVPIDHNDLLFVRLSMIKIFLSAAEQAKKAALKRNLIQPN
jgi:hypothetical protein